VVARVSPCHRGGDCRNGCRRRKLAPDRVQGNEGTLTLRMAWGIDACSGTYASAAIGVGGGTQQSIEEHLTTSGRKARTRPQNKDAFDCRIEYISGMAILSTARTSWRLISISNRPDLQGRDDPIPAIKIVDRNLMRSRKKISYKAHHGQPVPRGVRWRPYDLRLDTYR